jgi:hypothetical protein
MPYGIFAACWLVRFFTAGGLQPDILIGLRNNEVLPAGWAIDRMPGPYFIGFHSLPTMRTGKSHEVVSVMNEECLRRRFVCLYFRIGRTTHCHLTTVTFKGNFARGGIAVNKARLRSQARSRAQLTHGRKKALSVAWRNFPLVSNLRGA